jgi:two-component system, chemotaxis family, sensor kinase CheA
MADVVDLKEFLAGYLAEVEEHLASAGTNLLNVESGLERGEARPRAVRELFRSLHTIKGLSAMVGVEPVVDLAHEMESVLRSADRSGGTLSATAARLLVQGVRAIELRVQALAAGKTVAAAPPQLLDGLRGLLTAGDVAVPSAEVQGLDPDMAAKLSASETAQLLQGLAAGRPAWQIEFVPTPERIAAGIGITAIRARVEAVAEIVRITPRALPASADAPGGLSFVLLVLSDAPPAELAAAADTVPGEMVAIGSRPAEPWAGEDDDAEMGDPLESGRPAPAARTIRVPVERLDDALDKLSALVVTRFRLARAVAELSARGVAIGELGHIVAESGRQLRDLRNSFMRARMVSVAELLERVPLLVRGLRTATGKDVHLEIDAGRAELDKAVGDRIFPAIVHIIRNAVDHAIETPAERRAAGKTEVGLIRVACFERADNQLELTITDDGRGIEVDKLARRAGRPVPETDDQLLDLVTLRGISSADVATATSGRGMGMDIVQRVAIELGGELAVHTTPGAGTTFLVRVPLSITIVDAFTLSCSSRDFAVPVASIEEIIEVEAGGGDAVPLAKGAVHATRLFQRRGEAVPLVPLHALLGLAAPGEPPRKALVVRRNGQPFAFAVDRMIGRQEVVIKPLEDPLTRVLGVAGSTDLGDGRPTLVLDLIGFSRTLVGEEARP